MTSLYRKAYLKRKAEQDKGLTPGPYHRTAYLARQLETILESFSLTPRQVGQLLIRANRMKRGKGREKLASTTRKYELVRQYRAMGYEWEATTDRVNDVTGCCHDSSYYKKIVKRRGQ